MPLHPLPADTEAESWLTIVSQKAGGMRFGSVQIFIHEGRVAQVESTEKTRLEASPAPSATTRKKQTPSSPGDGHRATHPFLAGG